MIRATDALRAAVFFTVTLGTGVLPSRDARADEGMWPFNMLPKEQIKEAHNVNITDAWAEHVQLASVRFNNGGSGSFVSGRGLVLTNHHVAADCIAKLGSAHRDLLQTGFLAENVDQELKCADLELNQLISISDVTEQVQSARTPAMNDADGNAAIKAMMSHVEAACTQSTGLRCDVVTLYSGGRYHLYSYRKYTDIRLVFAPEQSIAFFGGDADNFTYPRYDLDMAIMRVYSADAPLTVTSFLKWNPAGPKDGDVLFVSGHPDSTGRMSTVAQLEQLRDTVYPAVISQLEREKSLLRTYEATGPDANRQARPALFGIENALKATRGFLKGLRDPVLMKKKATQEAAFRKEIEGKSELATAFGSTFRRYSALEAGVRGSSLFGIARDLTRLSAEIDGPSDMRLREYRDSNLASLYLRLFSAAPISASVEIAFLTAWLERFSHDLGSADPLVERVLQGRPPAHVAREWVTLTQLTDVNARFRLFKHGRDAIANSTDPLIVLHRIIDQEARAIRKHFEEEVEGPMRRYGDKIAKATFALHGMEVAPDATFTLRLSVGVAKGYLEGGKQIPAMTDLAGMFAHATGADPYLLPHRWLDQKSSLNLKTPINFVSTNDIIGGNSGSPVLAADGSIVGLIFDGNLSSLPNRFIYDETTGRAVSVNTAAITEALQKVYGAQAIAKELAGGQ